MRGADGRGVVIAPFNVSVLRKVAKSKDFSNLSTKDRQDLALAAINFAKQAGKTGVSEFMGSVSSQAANQAGMDSASLKQIKALEKQNENLDLEIGSSQKLKSIQDKQVAEKSGQEQALLKEIGALDSASTSASNKSKEANDALQKQKAQNKANYDNKVKEQQSGKSSQANKLKAEISGMETDLGTLKGAGVELDSKISTKIEEIDGLKEQQEDNNKTKGQLSNKINENDERRKVQAGALAAAKAEQKSSKWR